MLPKKYRLPLRQQPTFFLSARKRHSIHFIVFSLSVPKTTSQLTIIAPAKRFPLAVTRNKMKRVVSEACLAVLKKNLSSEKNSQFVIYIKRSITDSTFIQLQEELAATIL